MSASSISAAVLQRQAGTELHREEKKPRKAQAATNSWPLAALAGTLALSEHRVPGSVRRMVGRTKWGVCGAYQVHWAAWICLKHAILGDPYVAGTPMRSVLMPGRVAIAL